MILIIAAASFLATPLAAFNADPHLGDATRANLEAMIVPPGPRGPAIEGGNGVLAVGAIRRLESDKVKAPARATTSTVGASGG
ncbi:hypothetical protein KZX46_12095 [Polymorphobacter sp. PAMC 29334]|uniref:hypothetical protein n=1 Tax=Polymorphobacter sp. PAMC 29334 TaxID=2862331 RepID=UPI001C765CAC|nr:hypothetical protein [Polymorphobacter sp. PAMC 29334]QYE36586.1 hypothetical protein KZX46_12095 [Polymorphobacter sp. PAMC 29334]